MDKKTNTTEWLDKESAKFAKKELETLLPTIYEALKNSYKLGFIKASSLAANYQKHHNTQNETNT